MTPPVPPLERVRSLREYAASGVVRYQPSDILALCDAYLRRVEALQNARSLLELCANDLEQRAMSCEQQDYFNAAAQWRLDANQLRALSALEGEKS